MTPSTGISSSFTTQSLRLRRALELTSGWIVGSAFGLGGLAYIGLESIVERIRKNRGGSEQRTSMWMVYIAVAIDLFSDGLMIGAGTAVGTGLAVVLALGQVLADLPEGYATIANLRQNGVPRRKRLLLAGAFAVPVVVAALLAYYLLRGQGEGLQLSALVFTAGLLTVASVEDMVGEAHRSATDVRSSVLALIGGFVLFTFIATGLR